MDQDLSFLEKNHDDDRQDILSILSEKVKELIVERKSIELIEEQLKQAEKKERALSGDEIPALLLARGITSIKLNTGEKIEIQEKLAASIPKEDPLKRKAVFDWLVKNGGQHLIKQELVVDEPEQFILKFLDEKGVPYANEKNVNTNSFKAFLSMKLGMKKNTLAEIEIGDVPIEVNAFVYKETKIS